MYVQCRHLQLKFHISTFIRPRNTKSHDQANKSVFRVIESCDDLQKYKGKFIQL